MLGCSLSVAALASVRGHHGQVTKQISQGVTIDRQAKNRKELTYLSTYTANIHLDLLASVKNQDEDAIKTSSQSSEMR